MDMQSPACCREAEQQRLQETLEASESRWTEEIMRIRQDTLDEQVQRVSQMQVSSGCGGAAMGMLAHTPLHDAHGAMTCHSMTS